MDGLEIPEREEMGLDTSPERVQELKDRAACLRNHWQTPINMREYYGQKYSDALAAANLGKTYAYCRLGKMFEESPMHIPRNDDYEYPPLCYMDLAKTYYELAAASGDGNGACYLGELYLKEKDWEEAEYWLHQADKMGIKHLSGSFGRLYYEKWKECGEDEIVFRAYHYFKKETEHKEQRKDTDVEFYYLKLGDILQDILSKHQKGQEEDREIFEEMLRCYQKAENPEQPSHISGSINLALMKIYMGEFGFIQDIDKAFFYGDMEIRKGSDTAGYYLGRYLVENAPEDQERCIYYLERGTDFFGQDADKTRELLKEYVKNRTFPKWMREEAEMLMENWHFSEIGSWYHHGTVVKQDYRMAMYFYVRAKEGFPLEHGRKIGFYYAVVYDFLKHLEKEGITVPADAWMELEEKRTEKTHEWFGDEAMILLADLNARYHILDMEKAREQIRKPELYFDMDREDLMDLSSGFYSGGIMDELDRIYVKEYVEELVQIMTAGVSQKETERLYGNLIGLLDHMARTSILLRKVNSLWMSRKVAERITDYYLEKRLGLEIRQRYFGKREEDYRRHCHEHDGENWLNVVKSIEERHPDFMKYSEKKSKKIWQMRYGNLDD